MFASFGLAAREDDFSLPPSRALSDTPLNEPVSSPVKKASTRNNQNCRHPYRYDQSALSNAHRYISQTVCGQALWFDSFFGEDESTDTLDNARSFIRIAHTQSFRWEDQIEPNSSLRVRARVYLPTAEKRFGVILSGQSKDNPSTLGDTENLSGTAPTRDDGNITATFRWAEEVTNALGLDFDLSARFNRGQPVGIIRTRFNQFWDLGIASSLVFREEIFWRTDEEGFGALIRGGYNYRINHKWLYSIDNQFYHSENSLGWEWQAATGFSQKWRPKTAVIYSIGAGGQTEPDTITENYGASIRFRHNLHDGWLFVELQPRVDFPEERDRKLTPGISLRFEVHFGEE